MKSHSKSDLKPGEHQIIQTEGKPVWKVLKGAPVSSRPQHSETRKLFAFLKWATDRDHPLDDVKALLRMFFPKEIFTPETCLKIVKLNPYFRVVIPKKFWTKEIISHCFKRMILSPWDVPARFRTREICKLSIQKSYHNIYSLPWGTPWIEDLLIPVLRKHPLGLAYVPEKFRTLRMCLDSVKNDLNMVTHVPKHFREEVENQLKGIKK